MFTTNQLPQPEMTRLKIYLAGPTVFDPDHAIRFSHLKKICGNNGFEGVSPLDNSLVNPTAQIIYSQNIELIKKSNAVLADLTPFRNASEPDSGTCFEIGFAVALGIPVFVYSTNLDSLKSKIINNFGSRPLPGSETTFLDGTYHKIIEDFELPFNLMLGCSVKGIFETPEIALSYMKTVL